MSRPACMLLALLALLGPGCDEERVSRQMGAKCAGNDDCDFHCLPDADELPGGLCTRACNVSADCPDSTECASVAGAGFCVYACADDQDCDFLGTDDERPWTCHEAESRADQSIMVCLGGDE